jgi:hypothetical protein
MSDPNSTAISLPPGSYDYDDLKSGLDKAAKGAAKNYESAVDAALDTARADEFKTPDPRDIPGQKFVDVDNGLGGVENIQVFDQKAADKLGAEATSPEDTTADVTKDRVVPGTAAVPEEN